MNKGERITLLRNLKPLTWYLFCQMEALNDKEVLISNQDLALMLNLSLPSLSKYLATWESHGLIRRIPGGFIITQLNCEISGVTADRVVHKFRNATDIIKFWSECYQKTYGEPYIISNYPRIINKVKILLRFSDEDIQNAIEVIFRMYDVTWATRKHPRPTLEDMCNWLFQQALPYTNGTNPSAVISYHI